MRQLDTRSELEKIVEISHKIHKDDDVVDVDDDDDDDDAINTAGRNSRPVANRSKFLKRFLLDLNVNKELTSLVRRPKEKVKISDSVSKIFPNAREMNADPDEFDDRGSNADSISEVQMTVGELNDGNLPSNLQFFSGSKKNEEKLFENVVKNVGIISDSNQKFLEFLTSKFGENLLTKNKIQIHLDSAQTVIVRPANINFDQRRVAATKEIANRRGNGIENIKTKILLPQGKNVEVKHR